jgi:hypothetical protein
VEASKNEGGDDPAPDSRTWQGLLQKVGEAVIPAVLTAGGLVGFIAFAGSVIVWTRFQAAEVPPDQVVAAFPRSQLVAIASALLLLFGFVGLLAVIAFFLINREGKATVGMCRGLIGLLAVEGTVAIFLVEAGTADRLLACELFLLPMVIAIWATFITERPNLGEDTDGTEEQVPLDVDDGGLAEIFGDAFENFRRYLRHKFVTDALSTAALVGVLAGLVALLTDLPLQGIAIVALALIGLIPTLRLGFLLVDNPRKEVTLNPGKIPFTRRGQALILALLAVAAVGPWLALSSGWLPFSLLAAAVLVAGLWRIAVLSDGKFRWYGLAVFISVPLFGTLTGMARNIADPQVQPMALIRKADGPDESIQGIYVTETDDRIYFATVATEGCTGDIVPHSGRLLWVPKSEVVALSIGPLQSISDAAKTSLEMSYALTPVVETPGGNPFSPTEATLSEDTRSKPAVDRRLENVGSAVQPNFGAGVRLSPESASPGEIVTLRMSAPNHHDGVEGFGVRREGRSLRLGGVPVDIVKEEARGPFDSEFVEAEDGRTLSLAKGALYTRRDAEYVELDPDEEIAEHEELFVKVSDTTVAQVDDRGFADGEYLRLAEGSIDPPTLENGQGGPPEVVLEDGTKLKLNPSLLRQDWHSDHIAFRVPEHGVSGPITVECKQLAGQPLLRIARPPVAKISVQIEPGSRKIVFDGSGAVDEGGRIVARHWWVEGIDRGRGKQVVASLPPSTQSYSIRLNVVDSEGRSGTAELHLLRLPARLLGFAKHHPEHPAIFRQVRTALRASVTVEPVSTIQFEMRPGELPQAPNPDKTIDQAARAQKALLHSGSAQSSSSAVNPEGLTVRTMAFGAGCPAERRPDGRLDILVLGEGVKVVPPGDCPPVRRRTAHQLLPPP